MYNAYVPNAFGGTIQLRDMQSAIKTSSIIDQYFRISKINARMTYQDVFEIMLSI